MTILRVCRRHKTVLFPMAMLTETTSADPLDEHLRWQVAVGSGTLSPFCFGQQSLSMLNGFEAEQDRVLWLVLQAMAGIQGWA